MGNGRSRLRRVYDTALFQASRRLNLPYKKFDRSKFDSGSERAPVDEMCGDQHVVASVKSLYKNRIERCGHQGFSEFSLHCPNHAHGQKFDPDSQNCQNTFCRDRMARDCTIRHPVWPIVALQRRVRFSPRGWWGFAEIGVTRDALEGRNGPHFWDSSLISIFECHVCAKGENGR